MKRAAQFTRLLSLLIFASAGCVMDSVMPGNNDNDSMMSGDTNDNADGTVNDNASDDGMNGEDDDMMSPDDDNDMMPVDDGNDNGMDDSGLDDNANMNGSDDGDAPDDNGDPGDGSGGGGGGGQQGDDPGDDNPDDNTTPDTVVVTELIFVGTAESFVSINPTLPIFGETALDITSTSEGNITFECTATISFGEVTFADGSGGATSIGVIEFDRGVDYDCGQTVTVTFTRSNMSVTIE